MTKSFLFPEINSERAVPAPNENGLRRCFSPGSFAVFERCGFAAAVSWGGIAPPVGAAALVRAISSILHKVEKANCFVEKRIVVAPPVVQWIGCLPPKEATQVRFLPGG